MNFYDSNPTLVPNTRTRRGTGVLLIVAVLVLGTTSWAAAFAGAGDDYQGSLKPQVEQNGAPLDRADAIAALKSTSIKPDSGHRNVDRADLLSSLGNRPGTRVTAQVPSLDRADMLVAMRGNTVNNVVGETTGRGVPSRLR